MLFILTDIGFFGSEPHCEAIGVYTHDMRIAS
jgi:hypothetical protein